MDDHSRNIFMGLRDLLLFDQMTFGYAIKTMLGLRKRPPPALMQHMNFYREPRLIDQRADLIACESFSYNVMKYVFGEWWNQ